MRLETTNGTRRIFIWLLGFAGWLSGAGAGFGQGCSENMAAVVEMDRGWTLDLDALPGYGPQNAQVVVTRGPLYGRLFHASAGISYSGFEPFWDRGSDSFDYALTQQGGETHTGTVMLINGWHLGGGEPLVEDFESGGVDPALRMVGGNALAVSSQAAIGGDWGLRIAETAADETVYLDIPPGNGGANGGTHVGISIRTPPPWHVPPAFDGALLCAGEVDKPPLLKLRLRGDGESVWVRAETWNHPSRLEDSSAWVALGYQAHRLNLDWWPPLGGQRGGLSFWIDDRFIGNLQSSTPFLPDALRFQVGWCEGGLPVPLDVDDLKIAVGDLSAASRISLVDNFECGDFSSWTEPTGAGVRISSAAAILGNRGLEVDLSAGANPHLSYDLPVPEPRYSARFWVDPSLLIPPPGETLALSRASSRDAGQQPFQVQIRREVTLPPAYSLRARTELDDGTARQTPWMSVAAGPHVLEVDWRASAGPRAEDGYLRFWLDGQLVGERAHLDNDTQRIGSVALGAPQAPAGTMGKLYFDNFESWTPAVLP